MDDILPKLPKGRQEQAMSPYPPQSGDFWADCQTFSNSPAEISFRRWEGNSPLRLPAEFTGNQESIVIAPVASVVPQQIAVLEHIHLPDCVLVVGHFEIPGDPPPVRVERPLPEFAREG